jgi:hypothetical protein
MDKLIGTPFELWHAGKLTIVHMEQDGESRPVFLCLARPAESHYNTTL